jgi:hypothetical protein
MRKAAVSLLLSLLVLLDTGCEKGLAWGDYNAVIVVAPQAWWPSIRDSIRTVLAPSIVTVREEHTFRVTMQDPTEPDWNRLRLFREEIVIGDTADSWVQDAMATLDRDVEIEVPGILETSDVWARNQNVILLLIDGDGDVPSQVLPRLPTIHGMLLDRFLAEAEIRMFTSGRDTALADSLQDLAGFSLLLPEVYQWGRQDSLYVFRNDNPSPSELIRQFAVTWRTPAPGSFDADSLLDWRRSISDESYAYPQVADRDSIRTSFPEARGAEIFEIRGTWRNPPGTAWPAAGPFILWRVMCPSQDRMYLVDAWLYAPGKDKWEYMLQLETILGSFRCGAVRAL